jgi:hypothetical protein
VLVGAIPGVFIGAHISARANDRYIRPVLVAVLAISALKLLNVSNRALLVSSGVAVMAVFVLFVVSVRRRHRASAAMLEPELEVAPA